MQLLTPNEWMTKAASEIPDDQSAVLFMRHCERYTDPPDGDYSKLLLTPNGIKMANDIGTSINRKIRLLRSSPIERCKQTIREVIKFIPPEFAPTKDTEIKTSKDFFELLGNPSPKESGGVGWFEYFHYLQEHDVEAAQGISLEAETKHILDAIFAETLDSREAASYTDDSSTTAPLDLICSHDCHVIVLASALFDHKTDMSLTSKWCQFAEGLLFYGSRRNFTAFWRGQKKTFVDYM